MPHVPVLAPLPGRDAMGRTCVQDGLGRLEVLFPESYITCGRLLGGGVAEVMLGVICMDAGLLEKQVQSGVVAFCVLKQDRVMQLHRGSFEGSRPAYASIASDTFQASQVEVSGLSLEQLKEVRGRLFTSYKQYGVGVLVKNAGGFTYYVLVPNDDDYALHKAVYDGEPPKTERSPSPSAFTFAVPPSPVAAGEAGEAGETGPYELLDEEEPEPEEAEWAGPPGSLPRVKSYALDLPTSPRKRRKFDAEVAAMVRKVQGGGWK
jgi:hypothetical protein